MPCQCSGTSESFCITESEDIKTGKNKSHTRLTRSYLWFLHITELQTYLNLDLWNMHANPSETAPPFLWNMPSNPIDDRVGIRSLENTLASTSCRQIISAL
jgi:hypothetical protein